MDDCSRLVARRNPSPSRGTPCAATSIERMVDLMERRYQDLGALVVIGIILIFGGLYSDGLGLLGWMLAIMAGIALIVGAIGRRRGTRR